MTKVRTTVVEKYNVFDVSDQEEREIRRHMTPGQRRIVEKYIRGGWKVIAKGKWLFVAIKPGEPWRAVWRLRKNVDTKKSGLTSEQQQIISMLTAKGIDCRVEEDES